ncbi:MAG: RNA polymerase sigma-70 factor [Bacteroidota bacterium]
MKDSDRIPFDSLFNLLWEPMFIYASSLVMDPNTAKDLVQDVWVDYWQRSNEIEVYNIKAYLYKAIRYRCYNYFRDQKFNETQLEAANTILVIPEIEQLADVIELSERINATIEGLPKRCQEVFTLSRINDISNGEIARKLNISKRSVENQISLALRKLRKDLTAVRLFSFF